MDRLLTFREQLITTLHELHFEYEKEYRDTQWGKDTFARIFQSAEKGKLLRGALVLFSAQEYGHKIDRATLRVAALMELAHTGLLIHDDIMDQDKMRRGEKSIYIQFGGKTRDLGLANHEELGEALGICAGDIVFFMIFHEISKLDVPVRVVEVFSRELMLCAFGQMQDVASASLTEEDILDLYRNKTGRYSFSLPLMLGGALAKVPDQETEKMITFGQAIGPIFQIADDRIGIFGTQEGIGKPVGSDIKEGKNTLCWYLLKKAVSESKRKILEGMEGHTPSKKDILYIQAQIRGNGIDLMIARIEEKLEVQVRSSIEALQLSRNGKSTLLALSSFVKERKN